MSEASAEIDFQEAYEKEHLKNARLAERIALLEEQNDLLEFKLNRIKTNPLWVYTGPLRRIMHSFIRQVNRVKN